MEIKTVLVTGSEGYIGSVLIPKLLEKDYSVVGIDTGFFANTISVRSKENYTLHKQDIRDIKNIDLSGIDAIIHLAALSNDPMGALDQKLTAEINYEASRALAKKAKKLGIKKFIFSSSCSVYGTAVKDVVDESTMPHPLTEYAKSKIQTENSLQQLADETFQVILLRNSTVYGFAPHFRDDLVVNNLTLAGYTTGVIQVLSDGTPWRPLIDVRDLCDIFTYMLEDKRHLPAQPVNIGFPKNNVQVKDIVEKIHAALPHTKVSIAHQQPNDQRSYKVDFSLFLKLFPDVQQKWTLEKSIKDMILEFEKNKITLEMFENGKFTRLRELQRLKDDNKLNNLLYWEP